MLCSFGSAVIRTNLGGEASVGDGVATSSQPASVKSSVPAIVAASLAAIGAWVFCVVPWCCLPSESFRPAGGIRRHGHSHAARLHFVGRHRWSASDWDEIAGLLAVAGYQSCAETRELTERKLVEVRHRLEQLRQLEADLEQLSPVCGDAPVSAPCPALTWLINDEATTATPLPLGLVGE